MFKKLFIKKDNCKDFFSDENREEVYTPKLKYSKQAQILLSNLKQGSIDFKKLERWMLDNKLVIGDAWISEYIITLTK